MFIAVHASRNSNGNYYNYLTGIYTETMVKNVNESRFSAAKSSGWVDLHHFPDWLTEKANKENKLQFTLFLNKK